MIARKIKYFLIGLLLLSPFLLLIALAVKGVIAIWLFILSAVILSILYYVGFVFSFLFLGIFGIVKKLVWVRGQQFHQYKKKNWEERLSQLGFNKSNALVTDRTAKTLYKYRDWNNSYHKQVLLEQVLFFSSPLDFNDPFDCRIPIRFENLSDVEYENFINGYISIFGNEIQDNPMDVLDNPYAFRSISNARLRDYRKNLNLSRENQEILSENALNKFGIYCLSEDPANILMWSHYANNHSGICVGFRTDLLIKSIENNSDKGGYNILFFDKVKYVEDFPAIDTKSGTSIGVDIFSNKAHNWKYESEWRILIHFYDAEKRLLKVPIECIEEIYLGCKMKDYISSELIQTVKTINPSIKIYKAKKEHLKYHLKFEKVD